MLVLFMCLHVLGQFINSCGQKGDLDLGGSGIELVPSKLFNDCTFILFTRGHTTSLRCLLRKPRSALFHVTFNLFPERPLICKDTFFPQALSNRHFHSSVFKRSFVV